MIPNRLEIFGMICHKWGPEGENVLKMQQGVSIGWAL